MRDAGQLDAALERLAAVKAGPVGEREIAAVEQLRGQIAFDQRRVPEAARLLLSSARRFASLDAAAARATYLEALGAAMWAGDIGAHASRRPRPPAACRPARAPRTCCSTRSRSG